MYKKLIGVMALAMLLATSAFAQDQYGSGSKKSPAQKVLESVSVAGDAAKEKKIVNKVLATISAPKAVKKKQGPTARDRKIVNKVLATISVPEAEKKKMRRAQAWKKKPKAKRVAFAQNRKINKVIQKQLWAFRKRNASVAYWAASRDIKRSFGSAKKFMRMVKASYPQVYNSRKAIFPKLKKVKGRRHVQRVVLVGKNGSTVVAEYHMMKSRGKWRIAGCEITNAVAH